MPLQMSFVKMNISSSRTSSDIFARFGCIISPLCEIILSAGAELAGSLHQSWTWVHFCWYNPIQSKNGWY